MRVTKLKTKLNCALNGYMFEAGETVFISDPYRHGSKTYSESDVFHNGQLVGKFEGHWFDCGLYEESDDEIEIPDKVRNQIKAEGIREMLYKINPSDYTFDGVHELYSGGLINDYANKLEAEE